MLVAKRHTLANALRVAADQYEADALVSSKEPVGGEGMMSPEGRARLVERFEFQAVEVRRLADAIEQSDILRLED